MSLAGNPLELIQIPNQRSWPVGKAARYLGMSVETLKKLTDLGAIEAKWDRYLKRRFYLLEEMNRYIETQPDYNSSDGESPNGRRNYGHS